MLASNVSKTIDNPRGLVVASMSMRTRVRLRGPFG
jgi:hypothetical protein